MKKIIFLLCVILISSANSIELVDDVDDFNNTAETTTLIYNDQVVSKDLSVNNNTSMTKEYKCIFYEHQKCNIIDNIIFGIINSNITIVCFLMWYTIFLFMKYTCCVYNKPSYIKNILQKSS